jgi:hypothetical protein
VIQSVRSSRSPVDRLDKYINSLGVGDLMSMGVKRFSVKIHAKPSSIIRVRQFK